jgi:hypothetical protein
MGENANAQLSKKKKRDAYRESWQQHRNELMERVRKERNTSSACGEIQDIIFGADNIDMSSFEGTPKELEFLVERLYANDGR